jgi:hypothetical protein
VHPSPSVPGIQKQNAVVRERPTRLEAANGWTSRSPNQASHVRRLLLRADITTTTTTTTTRSRPVTDDRAAGADSGCPHGLLEKWRAKVGPRLSTGSGVLSALPDTTLTITPASPPHISDTSADRPRTHAATHTTESEDAASPRLHRCIVTAIPLPGGPRTVVRGRQDFLTSAAVDRPDRQSWITTHLRIVADDPDPSSRDMTAT